MMKLIGYIDEVKAPTLESAQKNYDDIVNPDPGTFCVCTDNGNGKGDKMTKEDIKKLQKEYDKNYEQEMLCYKKLRDFTLRGKDYTSISEKQYQEIISDKEILRLIYLFRYKDEVVIIIGDWPDDFVVDYLLKNRMNWEDRVI